MKKVLLVLISLALMVGALSASPMQPGPQKKALEAGGIALSTPKTRDVPEFTFTKNPMVIGPCYYDYMIGSYASLPLQVKRNGDGYFLTYHAKATSSSQYRRVFFAAIDGNGSITDQGEVSRTAKTEGFPALSIDPVSGKPFYAWHGDNDADGVLDVEIVSDAYYEEELIGIFNEVSVAIHNPWTIVAPNGGTANDNAFIWPQTAIGPSPNAGMRRIYVSARNSENHTPWTGGDTAPSENLLLAYADFNTEMIEFGDPLVWNHTSIPVQDNWHFDQEGHLRRPNNGLFVDEIGNVYYFGYHSSSVMINDSAENWEEPNVDLFVCSNYGEGEWTWINSESKQPTWNPIYPGGAEAGQGYFNGDDGPWADDQLYWGIVNSNHFNAVRLNSGKMMFPTIMGLCTVEGTYYPSLQFAKTLTLDPANGNVVVKDLDPKKDAGDQVNSLYTPWDYEEPWGEAEWLEDGDEWYLLTQRAHPFPHYNNELHDSSMYFHYNGIRVSEPNEDGLMVAVWQDTFRAKMYNENQIAEYEPFQNTPEIWIAVSDNDGDTWSEAFSLNNVETLPQFNNLKPMWVYPANKVITVGQNDQGQWVGKIGLLFFDDFTWGSNVHQPPAHSQNDGGNVIFTELQITFPIGEANNDNTAPAVVNLLNQNYPNPFNPETTISFDMPAMGNAKLEVFNVKGQLVKTLYNDVAQYGRNRVVWNGDDNSGQSVSSGVYFYRLSTAFGSQSRKMMLMK